MQLDLFGYEEGEAIPGLSYQLNFLTEQEERELLAIIRTLPLHPAQYKEHESRCRIISYGGIYDFSTNTVEPSLELDPRFFPLRERVAAWLGAEPREIENLLVTEYAPGTQLGWHRDVPQYETIVGISLGSAAVLRFRRYPPSQPTNRQSIKLELAPRSIYKLEGVARWEWQHSVPPVKDRRWSITLRTKRHAIPPRRPLPVHS
ncbi:alpha-ketoglutarate-dependent dioxygenase AlkB [Cupriavidus neocaledonicus]|uniref:2OG-Fe(II) oxygenase n=1 Tax=Cupriavidus neocaledonicus TaxID=1040979 RepID=A0A375HLH9_9BURK|nr:alpha-ketoglutarate-dependent dioxygenase AlkB [Cupriavidus neocaledonicus]SOZ39220.1 2OG-Fe(II) oxygenase superfamily protein [Cupriavidus neocaledonicus]SPD59108.1 2OG-Fe(II) oxygenase [Cupriavidus neocaledonicus]